MAGRRYALLIGASQFGPGGPAALGAGDSDVSALRDALCNPKIGGFSPGDVRIAMNAGSDETQSLVGWLCESREPEDFILLYYTGHGLKDHRTGKLFLALQNTTIEQPRTASLPASWLREEISLSASNQKLVILDCCHSGLFGSEGTAKRGVSRAVTSDTFNPQGEGSWTLASSTAEQESLADNIEHNSVFTAALVEALTTGEAAPDKEEITLNALTNWLQREVPERSKSIGGLMEPELLGRGTAPMIIAKNPNPSVPLDDTIVSALTDENVLLRRGAVAALTAYAKNSNSPHYNEALRLLKERTKEGGERDYELRADIELALSRSGEVAAVVDNAVVDNPDIESNRRKSKKLPEAKKYSPQENFTNASKIESEKNSYFYSYYFIIPLTMTVFYLKGFVNSYFYFQYIPIISPPVTEYIFSFIIAIVISYFVGKEYKLRILLGFSFGVLISSVIGFIFFGFSFSGFDLLILTIPSVTILSLAILEIRKIRLSQ